MDKKSLSERDICTKFITPAIVEAGWDRNTQIREEVSFTAGKVIVRGKLVSRGKQKRADYILYYKNNIPIAIIEAKDNKHSVSAGIQQGIDYAETLDIPFVFSSNGDAFLFHDRTVDLGKKEIELPLNKFPSPQELWDKYKQYKQIEDTEIETIYTQNYHVDASGKEPRYYQRIAINRAVEAIAKGQDRTLLVMATGTGKTYTACYAKFYNLSCIDNLEESFKNLKLEETNILKEILEDEKYNHTKQYQEIFEKNWAGQPKFICIVCFIVRKFKYHLKWVKDFFALPENCKFIYWKKNKGK